MIKAIVTVSIALFSFASSEENQPKNCFEYNTDYQGTNINNGLEQRTSSEDDCWTLCKLTLDCEGFTWASSNFPGTQSWNFY